MRGRERLMARKVPPQGHTPCAHAHKHTHVSVFHAGRSISWLAVGRVIHERTIQRSTTWLKTAHMHAHMHARTLARARAHTRTHKRTNARTHTNARTKRTHTHRPVGTLAKVKFIEPDR